MRGDERAAVWRHVVEQIEADRKFEISGVEIQYVVGAMWRHAVDHGLREIAMRIEQREAAAGREILLDHGKEERRLAGAGLADHVHVPTAIVECERDRSVE